MRLVIQRVSKASVSIENKVVGSIEKGLMVLVGVAGSDDETIVDKYLNKLIKLRIFEDEAGKTNKSIRDVGGSLLLVSQFTLLASYKKGNRPSWIRAATHDISVPLYNFFCTELSAQLGRNVATGSFGADMKVALVNDGPVTICMDSKARE